MDMDIEKLDDDSKVIKYKPLCSFSKNFDNTEEDYEIRDILIKSITKILNYSQRNRKAFMYNDEFIAWGNIVGIDNIIDMLIAGTVLPKVKIQSDAYDKQKKILKTLVRKYPLSNDVFSAIDNVDDKEIDYWRK